MSKKPVEIVEEPDLEDEGEESDEYEVEEEDDEDEYVEEEEGGEAGPSGKNNLTALLLGGAAAGGEDAEDEEDEEYDEEIEEVGANGAASYPASVSGVKRGRDEDDIEAEVRAGTTPDGELQGDYGEADELGGVVAASATKKARTDASAEDEL